LAAIPSVRVVACCGPPGQIPVLILYLTENLGLRITPLALALMVTLSLMAGLNLSFFLAARRLCGRPRRAWAGFTGLALGLLAGCPSCTLPPLLALLAGGTFLSLTSLLTAYQPLLILASLALLAAILLTTRRTLIQLTSQLRVR
jgi:hypothetical protein